MKLDNEDANSHTLAGLDEWTSYDVRVAAYNKVGISSYTDQVTDRTRESGGLMQWCNSFLSCQWLSVNN